jgi:hypothetical protein
LILIFCLLTFISCFLLKFPHAFCPHPKSQWIEGKIYGKPWCLISIRRIIKAHLWIIVYHSVIMLYYRIIHIYIFLSHLMLFLILYHYFILFHQKTVHLLLFLFVYIMMLPPFSSNMSLEFRSSMDWFHLASLRTGDGWRFAASAIRTVDRSKKRIWPWNLWISSDRNPYIYICIYIYTYIYISNFYHPFRIWQWTMWIS